MLLKYGPNISTALKMHQRNGGRLSWLCGYAFPSGTFAGNKPSTLQQLRDVQFAVSPDCVGPPKKTSCCCGPSGFVLFLYCSRRHAIAMSHNTGAWQSTPSPHPQRRHCLTQRLAKLKQYFNTGPARLIVWYCAFRAQRGPTESTVAWQNSDRHFLHAWFGPEHNFKSTEQAAIKEYQGWVASFTSEPAANKATNTN